MSAIRKQYWNFGFFQKHKKCSYFHNFGRMRLVNELVLSFLAPIKYAKAQLNLIILSRAIEYTTNMQTGRHTDMFVKTILSYSIGLISERTDVLRWFERDFWIDFRLELLSESQKNKFIYAESGVVRYFFEKNCSKLTYFTIHYKNFHLL